MSPSSLSFVSMNVRGFNNRLRRFMASRFIHRLRPSIVCIQEPRLSSSSFSAASFETSFPGYRGVYNLSSSTSGGVITLFSSPIFPTSSSANILSSCIHSVIALPNNIAISLYNIYGPPIASHRRSFFLHLLHIFDSDPLEKIIIGDLNLLPSRDRHIWHLFSKRHDIQIITPSSASGIPQHPHTYFRFNYSSTLDHCFVPLPATFYSHLHLCPMSFSDHHALHLSISPYPILPSHSIHRWRDYQRWQPPSSLFSSVDFLNSLKQILLDLQSLSDILSPPALWSLFKLAIKQECLSLHLTDCHSTRARLYSLSSQLISILNSLPLDTSLIINIKAQIHRIHSKSLIHMLSKLRTLRILNQERPTSLFYKSLHNRKSSNLISSLQHPDHPSITLHTESDITSALHSHYSHRFASRPSSSSHDILTFFSSLSPSSPLPSSLSPQAVLALSSPVSLSELTSMISSHPGSSAAGPDGLGAVFYITHGTLFLPLLLAAIHFFSVSQSLPHPSSFPSVLSIPILKKTHSSFSSSAYITDFRLISTINYDLRLIARIINSRLGSFISSIIHPHSYAIKGRNINHSSLIQFTAANFPSTLSHSVPQLLKVDLANAFDHTSLLFLFQTIILLLGYSPLIHLLLFLLSSRVLLLKLFNSCSPPIFVTNGILQGCPLSSTLFSLYMHPVLHSIDRHIHGLQLAHSSLSIKSLAFVDDLVVGCRNFSDALSALRVIRSFQFSSGSPINHNKTFIFHLLPPHSSFDHSFSSHNSMHTLNQRILGHYLLPSQTIQRTKQLQDFLSYSSNFVSLHRHLSIHARVSIINTMLISRFSYFCLFLKFPVSWFSSFYQIIRTFLWSSLPYVSLSKLFLPRRYGGLGLINLRLFFLLRRVRFRFSFSSSFNPSLALYLSSSYSSFFSLSPDILSRLSLLFGSDLSSSSYLRYGSFLHTICLRFQCSSIPPRYFSVLKLLYLTPGQKNFLFSLTHQCLPVASYLVLTKHLSNISITCIFCLIEAETFPHLFFHCSVVQNLVLPLLSSHHISLSLYKLILTSHSWSFIPVKTIKKAICIAFALWKHRCNLIFASSSSPPSSFLAIFQSFQYQDRLHLPSHVYNLIW